MSARTTGQVRVVGTGLLGTSIGLGLSSLAVDVVLDDVSPATLALAVDYGAGRPTKPADAPALVVVAVPPDVTADVVAAELARYPEALVTDVASVKAGPLAALEAAGAATDRYLGGHPMAGRERGGPIAGRADLFLGRPWVITPHAGSRPEHAAVLEALALDLGAVPVRLAADRHDDAVAVVSHAPQLVSSLLAARLVDAPDHATDLAGQGLRDTTRIAASDPTLWVEILSANAARILPILTDLRDDLDAVLDALADPSARGARRALADVLAAGNDGVARIPGKHGVDLRTTTMVVLVDDRPGQIARLLTEIGELGVNLEDMRLEHSPGAPIGIVEIAVAPEVAGGLEADLRGRGWRIA
ncbi:prephenate dehydrogenase [Amnibacterium kyonggiense]|uniref:Prephenate dehydrogenase n=1 Tax=Amnibacterium kyonggiense TaxID=595671 RepID=A0A4R7FKB7_9MICO|nr:prephenate dehydrogenase [Amnibacterium kyonggiense]TDS76777.1 prephenate dehydrogenase [Amnibacterium kyonggiense]